VLRPDEGGAVDLRVSVVDQDGRPVEGVGLSLGDKPIGSTGSGGMVRLTGLAPGVRDLTVIGDLLRGVKPIPVELFEGLQDVVVPVRWVPGAVEIRVVGPDGPTTDARIRLAGSDVRTFDVDDDGVLRTSLPPGDWSVVVSSPTYGVQQRALHIAKESEVLHRVEVSLRPPEGGLADLSVRLVNPEGSPVSGAMVSLDGYSLGRTGPDGGLVVEGLGLGPRDLQVESTLYALVDKPIRLMEGQQEVEEVLEWAEGAVRVLALSQGKPVPDALVRLLGPAAVPSGPVDEQGTRTVALSPGRWQALVSSPAAGVALQGFVVPAGATDRLDVEVNLEAVDSALVQVVLRVVDPEGVPVSGAAVRLGGNKVGMTGDGGVLIVNEGLVEGTMVLMVEHPTHQLVSTPIEVRAGSSERVVELGWKEQRVELVLVDEDGQPATGEVVWRGPSDVLPTSVDPSGKATVSLRPGRWQAIVSGPKGLGRSAFLVETGPVSVQVEVGATSLDAAASSIAVLGSVLFDVNASALRDSARGLLDQVATELLREGGIVSVEVQGHTDATGSPALNQALSEARAESVLEALVERGVPREILLSRGYGPQRPVADNNSEDGRSKNRRVQFEVMEQSAP
jgi:outer membrane protein OmpA-like peptidoglycan-associated protein